MGANIGTTVTGQLIRMADISGDSLWLTLIQPKTFAPVVAFVGCIFYVFIRNAKKKNIGQIMLGFGILFTGMSLMDTGVSPAGERRVPGAVRQHDQPHPGRGWWAWWSR